MGDIPEEAMEWTKRKGSGVWKNWSATKDDLTERITDLKLIDPIMTREESRVPSSMSVIK